MSTGGFSFLFKPPDVAASVFVLLVFRYRSPRTPGPLIAMGTSYGIGWQLGTTYDRPWVAAGHTMWRCQAWTVRD
jgi:hypothetical protein